MRISNNHNNTLKGAINLYKNNMNAYFCLLFSTLHPLDLTQYLFEINMMRTP